MTKRGKHLPDLDEDQLVFAVTLIEQTCKTSSPKLNLQRALLIMEFGNMSIEGMRDFLEATI